MTNVTAKVTNAIKTEICMKETSKTEKPTEEAFSNGKPERLTMVSGRKASKMASESGEESIMNTILVNGKIAEHMAKVCMCGATGTNTRVNGEMDSNMVKAATFSCKIYGVIL
jgi:hypothetical protein